MNADWLLCYVPQGVNADWLCGSCRLQSKSDKKSLSAFSRSRRHQIKNVCCYSTKYITHSQYRFMSLPVKCSLKGRLGPKDVRTEIHVHTIALVWVWNTLISVKCVAGRDDRLSVHCCRKWSSFQTAHLQRSPLVHQVTLLVVSEWWSTSSVLLKSHEMPYEPYAHYWPHSRAYWTSLGSS